jgi:hypothetical protein
VTSAYAGEGRSTLRPHRASPFGWSPQQSGSTRIVLDRLQHPRRVSRLRHPDHSRQSILTRADHHGATAPHAWPFNSRTRGANTRTSTPEAKCTSGRLLGTRILPARTSWSSIASTYARCNG